MSIDQWTIYSIATRPDSSWMKRHPLVGFYVLAYGFAWLLWIPFLVLSQNGLGWLPFKAPAYLLAILGGFSPALAAIIMTALVEGKPGVIRLLRRCVQWRVGLQWYPLIVFSYPVAFFATSVLLGAIPLSSVLQQWSLLFTFYPLLLVPQVILGGGLGEEPGWRGFALPRLQGKSGAVPASLIVGVLWSCWHLPLFLVPELSQANLNLVLFLLTGIALAVIMTWVYNNTGGSLLLMMVLHEAQDTTALLSMRIAPGYLDRTLAYIIAFGLIAAMVLFFTRGNLSYKHTDTSQASSEFPNEKSAYNINTTRDATLI